MTVEESVAQAGIDRQADDDDRGATGGRGGHDVAVGEVGELWLRGPHVSLGYWNNPEATAAALDRDGWFHTGDLARRDAEGFFTIAGRRKDMLISGGVNVYPGGDRGRAAAAPVGGRRGHRGHSARDVGRSGRGVRRRAPWPRGDGRGPDATPGAAARSLQMAEGVRVRRVVAANGLWQGPESRPARRLRPAERA